jgi:serine/threonine protein phosphatase PrpC
MKEQTNSVRLQVASVSDRGLSEKRPLNEDSYLSDSERRIFAVADGVGGAQAGEVASQTAVEVLDEAFRHQVDGADIEDLMEIAIQRANNSIHRMALEQPKLAAMATTVVALHLDGHVATIGHVGDSRLYRLSPDGKLHRETEDHSVVEEEVRAGRMTPEQAAHHPSRNVISRALGAETGVEVDMKTIEIEDGTAFLLCSDGITRHIPDNEIRDLLAAPQDVEEICAEMKRLCYERGAEDNLTAVIVRVGDRASADTLDMLSFEDEPTVQTTRSALATTVDSAGNPPQPVTPSQNSSPAATAATPSSTSLPPPPVNKDEAIKTNPVLALEAQGKSRSRKGGGRGVLLLLLILGIGAAAFYGGIYFQRQRADSLASANATPTPTPTPADPVAEFEKKRLQVDKEPAKMRDAMKDEEAAKGTLNPLESNDPEFLYLYGRSLLLTGDYTNALAAFERASASVPAENASALYDKLAVESRLAIGASALKLRLQHPDAEQRAIRALDEMVNKTVAPPLAPR